jgi:uroporphyrinogen-III synthase
VQEGIAAMTQLRTLAVHGHANASATSRHDPLSGLLSHLYSTITIAIKTVPYGIISSSCIASRGTYADKTSLPLHGKRIMLTAPRQYAERLTARIVEAGARPIWIPAIETTHLSASEHQQTLVSALKDLASYDMLLFTSRNGIVAVLNVLKQEFGDLKSAADYITHSNVQCWALGVDAEALHMSGIMDVQVPDKASTQGLVAQLSRMGLLANRKALCPVPLVIPPLVEPSVVPDFLRGLQQSECIATRVNAYETSLACSSNQCKAEKNMLESGEIDAIALSSTAEAQGLLQAVGKDALLHAVKRGLVLAAHGPQTAAGAGKVLGLEIACVSKDYSSFAGLIHALEQNLGLKV